MHDRHVIKKHTDLVIKIKITGFSEGVTSISGLLKWTDVKVFQLQRDIL